MPVTYTVYDIYALGQSTVSEWYWQFHEYWFHRNIPNKTHKVYPIYLHEKLNISNEIKSFSHENKALHFILMKHATSLKNYKCTKYIVIHYCSSYLVQFSGKLHTIKHTMNWIQYVFQFLLQYLFNRIFTPIYI